MDGVALLGNKPRESVRRKTLGFRVKLCNGMKPEEGHVGLAKTACLRFEHRVVVSNHEAGAPNQ